MNVKLISRRTILPFSLSAVALVALLILVLSTSPVRDVGYALSFFALLLLLLVSLGYLWVSWRVGNVKPKTRYRIFIISIFIVVAAMFKSAGSLSLADGLVVILIVFGLLFYFARRP